MAVTPKIAIIIPAYKVTRHIMDVLALIGPDVSKVYVVDDCCPEKSGELVMSHSVDQRVKVISHSVNLGVGGAMMTGYAAAIEDGMEILVKIDGDGQMDPRLVPQFTAPIARGDADYTKGNRFFDLEQLRVMPKIRLYGNAVLSFMTKLSSGYWDLFDPTNGFTAIHVDVARHLPFGKISRRYFFETDMLFRLNTLRAVVIDIPMNAKYQDEKSNLNIRAVAFEFLVKHGRNFLKRIFYNYYLRDMSLASVELPAGLMVFLFGILFGAYHWGSSIHTGVPTPTGTIMLSVLPIIVGIQFVLAFLAYDMSSIPRQVLHKKLGSFH